MRTGIRDTLYRLLESAEPSADFRETLRNLEDALDKITKHIYRATKQLDAVDAVRSDWKLEQEGMSLLVNLVADKYDGFDEEDLSDLEQDDREMLEYIFSVDTKARDKELEVVVLIWKKLLAEYKVKEMEAISEIEKYKLTIEDEIAKSFMEKWDAFVKTRGEMKAGNYD